MAKRRSRKSKEVRKLINLALDNYFFFLDDEIEDTIDALLTKFKGREDWRKLVRSSILGNDRIREKIAAVALGSNQ